MYSSIAKKKIISKGPKINPEEKNKLELLIYFVENSICKNSTNAS